MKDVNKVILVGRLGADPVQKETQSGKSMCRFSVATRIQSDPERTEWHRVVVWGNSAQPCAKYLHKGDLVYLEGSLRSHKFVTDDDETRMIHEIHAYKVNFLSLKREEAADETMETDEAEESLQVEEAAAR